MINFDNNANHYWSSIKNSIIGGFESGKPNALFNLIKHQADIDIDKIYLYARQIHTNQNVSFYLTMWKSSLKHCNDPKFFIESSDDMQRC